MKKPNIQQRGTTTSILAYAFHMAGMKTADITDKVIDFIGQEEIRQNGRDHLVRINFTDLTDRVERKVSLIKYFERFKDQYPEIVEVYKSNMDQGQMDEACTTICDFILMTIKDEFKLTDQGVNKILCQEVEKPEVFVFIEDMKYLIMDLLSHSYEHPTDEAKAKEMTDRLFDSLADKDKG